MKKIFLTTGLLLIILCGYTQQDETFELSDIKGQAMGGISSSPAKVIDKAIKNAKIKALTEAGIHEQINTYQNLYKSETKDEYEEVFMSDIFTNISGVVSSVNVTDTVASFNNKAYTLTVNVTIDATVIKYAKKQDRTFDAWIEGIKPFYENESTLQFTVKPTLNCYARVFLIARKQESYMVYPTKHENDIELKAMQMQQFPTQPVDYYLETKYPKEPHRLIIVLLKEPIPYTKAIAYKPILNWIFSISPQKRVVKSFGFTVVKN